MTINILFATEFINSYKELLISVLSLIVSLAAYSLSRRSLSMSEQTQAEASRIKAYEKRSEILEAIDKKNAKIGNLMAIYAEKLLLIERSSISDKLNVSERERIKNNISVLQKFSSQYDLQRSLAEQIDQDGDIAFNEKNLADIKRLLIHLEEDIIKEERGLNTIKESITIKNNL